MEIDKLIKNLEEVKKEYGSLEVYCWADHGQCSMSTNFITVGYLEDSCEPTVIPVDSEDWEADYMNVNAVEIS